MRHRGRWLAMVAGGVLVLGVPASRAGETATGQVLFQGACAGCHEAGSPRVLAGQPLLPRTRAITGGSPAKAIRIILHGRHPAPERRGAWMPAFGPVLDDGQIADILAWLRRSAGAPPWPDLVRQVRAVRAASPAGEIER